jgi:hypothetical protein
VAGFNEAENDWWAAWPRVRQPLSRIQAERLIVRLCAAHRLRVPGLVADPAVRSEGNYGDGLITVPGFPVERWVVWHELAHHGHDTRARLRDAEPHGSGFVRWYLRLISEEAGGRVAGNLAARLAS